MSKIEELIKEKCPNGVKFKRLNEISDSIKGMSGVSNKWSESGNCRFIDYMNAYKNLSIDVTRTPFATVNNILNQTILEQNDILFTSASETINECALSSVIEQQIEDIVFMDDHLFGIRFNKEYKDKIYVGFMKHYLRSQEFRLKVDTTVRGVTRFYVSKPDFMKLTVPIPPLDVQKEIARILDEFSKLEAELEAELEARKQQYEFWRGKLLSDENCDIKLLGNIATFSQGIQVNPEQQFDYCNENMVPFLRIVDFVKEDEPPRYILKPDNKYMKQENTEMVMIRYGASAAGKVFINKYGAIANNMFKVNIIDKNINIQYLQHFLSQNSIYQKLNNTGGESTMPAINFKLASSIKVNVPSLNEQKRIVNILDKFDKLINDITVGIPAEIELRRKQYEYYRNKLLSFEELLHE